MTKTLIAYFSASGQTKKVAEKLNTLIASDLHEIVAKQSYTSDDLNWHDQNSRSSLEMNDKASRPEIDSKVDISQYDTILLGFPVWWYTAPRIINTFMEENNVKNKTIYTFVTSGSTGSTGCVNDLKEAYPDNTWKEGKRLTTNVNEKTISDWID
ncbi:MAG: hypothetical protein BZ136_00865 [Methanosphaera sp. rholeuAM74]|nr:MAG: hypothetical protein BZ136_00865 [Methanosphaera sp. rholeuAM74]